ncbi:hypothetical protein AURDEDRAFT_174796 [Auricularia subglabra TFB-10046 SS5]|nr:hypothetical protein AURDEDRAFT_174796 [Auricularia subglabra TFB-10046 SS5]
MSPTMVPSRGTPPDTLRAAPSLLELRYTSLKAHEIVLKKIYEIFEEDCGAPLHFSYMHGAGWDTVAADEHPGESLGFGRFALWVAGRMLAADSIFAAMSPYDHLAHFYMLCISHYKRNCLGRAPHTHQGRR